MNNYHVTQVSSDEEYFTCDRDSVYCKHGQYIGYPGGPDYICGYCEDGLNKIKTRVYLSFGCFILFKSYRKHIPLRDFYSLDSIVKSLRLILNTIKIKKMGLILPVFSIKTEKYWSK